MTDLATLTRRAALLGIAASLGGCSALSSLNAAATPLATFDLLPVPGPASGPQSGRTILVARPGTPAAITTDRIVIKPNPLSIAYLPEGRWPEELPSVLQSLLVRSISGTGRVAYVGPVEGGPVPDIVLLSRVDAFQAETAAAGVEVVVDLEMTLLNDRDQRVIASRGFERRVRASGDVATAVVPAFQAALDAVLPEIADWVVAVTVRG
ncbi:ABC-type transport auxiliary lipoprotein family protein [uncultured Jannaschia sp.]|uniref:ABC-type transport auxiliary lipoprotein family protein n=1 Tax=uncultured Jannaschia sp. TaxID=293347 RepID=UPI0026386581|nr:ABC-type transport auxiliary lipoprotein family protein [uncultured Jannaschia sp.]